MTKPKISVVILHFGDPEYTARCLASVLKAKRMAEALCETTILIIDNGAEEAPLARLADAPESIEVITNAHNLGFASGMNVGVRRALDDNHDYVWLLNNDTEVEETALGEILAHLKKNPGQKWVGCQMLDGSGTSVKPKSGYQYFAALSAARPITNSAKHPDYLDGAAMFLCCETLKELGGLPEHNFLYFEELHLARALASRGVTWGLCERAKVFHARGACTSTMSLEDRAYHLTTAALRYTRQHTPRFFLSVCLVRLCKGVFDTVVRREIGPIKGTYLAVAHNFSSKASA